MTHATLNTQPKSAKIIAKIQESPSIFTLMTEYVDNTVHPPFHPGQFNMVYLAGVGEVPISIASDPDDQSQLSHTIRAVGRVTRALQALEVDDEIGLRGPYGKGWPIEQVTGKDVLIITGGLGCAPTRSVINYLLARRPVFGKLTILQGVKHSDDFIYRTYYQEWAKQPNTEIHIAANVATKAWPWYIGYVTELIDMIHLNTENTLVMMCGPELMMHSAIKTLISKQVPETQIYLSMERNMVCGIGHCGHCQYGGLFICKDGPVFAYPQIKALFTEPGF